MINSMTDSVDLFEAEPMSDGIPILIVHGVDLPRPSVGDCGHEELPAYQRKVHDDGTESIAYQYTTWHERPDGSVLVEMGDETTATEFLCIDITSITRVEPIGWVEPPSWR